MKEIKELQLKSQKHKHPKRLTKSLSKRLNQLLDEFRSQFLQDIKRRLVQIQSLPKTEIKNNLNFSQMENEAFNDIISLHDKISNSMPIEDKIDLQTNFKMKNLSKLITSIHKRIKIYERIHKPDIYFYLLKQLIKANIDPPQVAQQQFNTSNLVKPLINFPQYQITNFDDDENYQLSNGLGFEGCSGSFLSINYSQLSWTPRMCFVSDSKDCAQEQMQAQFKLFD